MAISKPCCPDSFTKFLLDLFSSSSTAGMFYTTDMRVLIDIVTRQLTDLCPGMEVCMIVTRARARARARASHQAAHQPLS